MTTGRLRAAAAAILLAVCGALLSFCGSASTATAQENDVPLTGVVKRPGFLGAFFRPEGTVPYGVFSVDAKQRNPVPYPSPSTTLFGPHGYCDAVADNGVSISSGHVVDATKLADIVDLGVKWTRGGPSPFFDDVSHIYSSGRYEFGDFDSAQCALAKHHIVMTVTLDAGPVQYDVVPGQFSPKGVSHYKTAGDFAQWCSAVVAHERATFPAVHRYTLPGNEVNSNPQLFPGGEDEIASYAESCYRAVKRIDPQSFVYGFELNMDARRDPAGFVRRMVARGCKVGTCYDGLSIHLALKYPIPPANAPCYPNPGGTSSMQCLEDIRAAAQAPIHFIIGETAYFVPSSVPDEATKAKATVAEFEAFARVPYIDGANYANVDECDLYPSGYFVGGCIVDSIGNKLPAYDALQKLAHAAFM
jgi:hypothetical protein